MEAHRDLPGKATTLWLDTTPETRYPSLTQGLAVDTVVIGGGLAGLSVATLLKDAGQRVAVIEAKRIATGVTGHTTAKITALHGLVYRHLVSRFGKERAGIYAHANQSAIEVYARLIEKKKISCDFERKTAYTFAQTEEDRRRVLDEVRAAETIGLPVGFVEEISLPFRTNGAVFLGGQAHFHPRKYLLALAEDLSNGESHLFEQTRGIEINGKRDLEVVTDKGRIRAGHVVVATHFPMKDPLFFFARMVYKRSYVLVARLNAAPPDGMFYSTSDPYISVRNHPAEGEDLVFIGGENHKTGHAVSTIALYRRLERFARENFDIRSIDYRWSTQDNVTVDRVPYIGRISPISERIFVATGFGGWGMAHAMVSAIVISDAILGRQNPWASFYAPTRHKVTDTSKIVAQNLHAVKHLAAERIVAPNDFEVKALAAGEGGVIREKGKMKAVARDQKGRLHMVSPSCTHMGCIVSWNDGESSWDCPCHGSRFAADGNVIHGPAARDLQEMPPGDDS